MLPYRDREAHEDVVTGLHVEFVHGDGESFRLVTKTHPSGMAYLSDGLLAIHALLAGLETNHQRLGSGDQPKSFVESARR